MPIFAQKQCFLGSGGQFNAPPPYFAGAQLNKTCVAGLESRKIGDSGPPPVKGGHFLPKNGLKMPFVGQKQCFLGSGGQFHTPPPYFSGARLGVTCVAGVGCLKIGDSGPPPLKNGLFAQKWLKNAIFGPKTGFFFGLGGQFYAPPPYFAGAGLKETCVAGLGGSKKGDSGPAPLKDGLLLPKNGLKLPFLGHKQCFLGSSGQFNIPPPYFAVVQLRETCVAGLRT